VVCFPWPVVSCQWPDAGQVRGSRFFDSPLTTDYGLLTTDYGLRTTVHFTPSNSTSKIRVAFGGIAPPAPLAP